MRPLCEGCRSNDKMVREGDWWKCKKEKCPCPSEVYAEEI